MKLTFKAIALVAALVSAPAMADPFTSVSPLDNTVDLSSTDAVIGYAVAAEAQFVTAAGAAVYDGSVAIVQQLGDANYAWVDQSGGVGNFAVVAQDSSADAANTAFIGQVGNGNFATVSQH